MFVFYNIYDVAHNNRLLNIARAQILIESYARQHIITAHARIDLGIGADKFAVR